MPYIANLTELRLRVLLSQSRFAAKAGVDRETVARCEKEYEVQDVSCARIRHALIELGIPASEITVMSGGKIGPIRKKDKEDQSKRQPKG